MYDGMTIGAITMPASTLSRMQKKGQVTIPAEYRKKLGLKEGDLVAFTETEEGLLLSRQEVVAMDALDKIGRALAEQGISLEDLLNSGDDIREQLVKDRYPTTQQK